MEGNNRRKKYEHDIADDEKKVIQLPINIKNLGGESRVSVECTDTRGNY